MILTDAGPLVAIIDRGEEHHRACVECLTHLNGPMLTTWPAFTEALYLLGDAGGWKAQRALWQLVEREDLRLSAPETEGVTRMRQLMEKYKDRPMDLADASLVVLAEDRGLTEIFTLDHVDFSVYRLRGRRTFLLWPREL